MSGVDDDPSIQNFNKLYKITFIVLSHDNQTSKFFDKRRARMVKTIFSSLWFAIYVNT